MPKPPEWQGERLGTYGPDAMLHDDWEPFNVERAPSTSRCKHYDSDEDRWDESVSPCHEEAVFRFHIRDPEDYSWTLTDRCSEHATGPDLDILAVPRATNILWIDAAEAYCVCGEHYYRHDDDQWTGSTPNPREDELAEALNEELEAGTPCTFCQRDAGVEA